MIKLYSKIVSRLLAIGLLAASSIASAAKNGDYDAKGTATWNRRTLQTLAANASSGAIGYIELHINWSDKRDKKKLKLAREHFSRKSNTDAFWTAFEKGKGGGQGLIDIVKAYRSALGAAPWFLRAFPDTNGNGTLQYLECVGSFAIPANPDISMDLIEDFVHDRGSMSPIDVNRVKVFLDALYGSVPGFWEILRKP